MNYRHGIYSALILFVTVIAGCGVADHYPNRPITLVCPWAAGGGTDRVSRQMAMHLEHELGVPVNVINATGGKGVTGHRRGLRARPDGYTVTMVTLELNMMHWSGLTSLTYEDCTPLMSVNEDYASLFVRKDAPWQSLVELNEAIQGDPSHLTASGTASGGAWHLAMAGWLTSQGMNADDVTWVSETGAGPSLQQLLSGGVDMVCCSLPEARALLESGKIRALGVMAPDRVQGFESIKTFHEQDSDWVMASWRGLAVPKGTPKEVVDVLVRAIERVVTGNTKIPIAHEETGGEPVAKYQTFPESMVIARFNNTWRRPDDFRQFLATTDRKLGKLLTSDAMRSVNTDRFNPMLFPYLLLGALGMTLVALTAQSMRSGVGGQRRRKTTRELADDTSDDGEQRSPTPVDFAAVIAAVVVYILFAEVVGFVVLSGMILFTLLCWLGTRASKSVILVIVLVPIMYQIFANVLRVPLPRGWWGW